jgi:hypothetical protein
MQGLSIQVEPTMRAISRHRRAALMLAALAGCGPLQGGEPAGTFRAGACAVDIMPARFPVLVSGGFLESRANGPAGTLHARCLVLDDGATRVALAVVDTLMMTRELCDEVKERAAKAAGIPADRILISAVHTHSAPSVMGALGTGVQEDYVPVLRDGIVKGIVQAARNLAPARAGWAVADAGGYTHCRRWILRPDRIGTDPFGQRNVRAMMHPGYQSPHHVGPAGPVDPDLTLLAVRSPDGRPIAVLANFSMHYFGAPAVSSDYYGIFCDALARRIAPGPGDPPVVAILSQGTSGDLHWMDYGRPKQNVGMQSYAGALATVAQEALAAIDDRDRVTLAMSEKKVRLGRRVTDAARLAWARAIVEKMGGRPPKSQQEVYAREAICLHDEPARELKIQALRVGDLGLTAIPCEVFGITGLKIKGRSPLRPTMNLELANGAEGYIPPPEQHAFGGYTTWPARTAALEVNAEPAIVETVLQCLEEVAGRPRRAVVVGRGAYAEAVLAAKPLAYWRMEELSGSAAADAAGRCPAAYEDGIAFYLEGPPSAAFSGEGAVNRCAHFAGGRMKADVPGLGTARTVELWFWNGLPSAARDVTGVLCALGETDALALGGTGGSAGRLVFGPVSGTREIPLRTWHHVALVRDGPKALVYLDGQVELACDAEAVAAGSPLWIGGRADGRAGFEGKIDEVAVYGRALSADEIAAHVAAAALRP